MEFLAAQHDRPSQAMEQLRSAIWVRRGGLLAATVLLGLPVVLAMVPWQQPIVGSGRVAAYAPLDRQQTIEAPIAGRIVNWSVQEGSTVRAGDPLLEISFGFTREPHNKITRQGNIRACRADFCDQFFIFSIGVSPIHRVKNLV